MQGQDRRFDSGTDDARCSDTQAAAMRREEARLQGARGVASSMGHPEDAGARAGEIGPDDLMNLSAAKEVRRLHNDAYLVETDLEDQDQREAAPGTREQE